MKIKSASTASLVIGAGLIMAACSTLPSQNTPGGTEKIHPVAKRKTSTLTHEEAVLRSKQVAHPTYTLWFGLDGKAPEYDGRAVINFDLRPKGKELSKSLFIDFEAGTLRSLTVNGALQPIPQYDGHRIVLRTQELLPGSNRVEVAYSHPYSQDGNGLHRFEDPVDHRVYLYSHFEPYSAHKMFPCFDQPDLKASFELTVETPSEWQVVSNTLEREVNKIDGRESWAFPPSPLFSTYVLGLHAGPYKIWKSTANGVPLRLLARESLAELIDADKWFEVTSQGIEYYNLFFGYPFPYSKYDQIIVPEFNAGGMENAAAVTLTERAVFRSKPTQDQLRKRASLILHEMAHMWFGDLVTMKWWNGLWLNESFANYMSSKAIEQATSFKGEPQDFFIGSKSRAYSEDQLITTHPIETPVADTDAASANFDSITYGKGASVLKQLNYYLGEDDFKEGIQRYFQKYALKSTSLHDFFKMLGEASGKDLNAWQKAWLQTAGVNTLQPKWSCKEGEKGSEIENFSLLQGYDDEQPHLLRPHRTLVALYGYPKARGKKAVPSRQLQLTESVNVAYSGAETRVEELIGKPCPTFVFPNHMDFDYAKVILDPVSLEAIQKNLAKIEDSFARQMIWESMWQMVLDGKFRPQDYAELVLNFGAKETDTQILSTLLKSLIQSNPLDPSVYKFLPIELRKELQPKVEAFIRKNLLLAPAGSDLQQEWFNAFLRSASEAESLELIQKALAGKSRLRGFPIDQHRRWQLVKTLARNTYPDLTQVKELIAKELKADPSDKGKEEAIASEASIPDSENKKIWLSRILQPVTSATGPASAETLTIAKLRNAIWSFHLLGREDLSRLSVDSYFETLPKLGDPALDEFAANFAGSMFPALCDADIVKRTSLLLDTHSELPMPITKRLKMRRQREEQCLRIRQKALSAK